METVDYNPSPALSEAKASFEKSAEMQKPHGSPLKGGILTWVVRRAMSAKRDMTPEEYSASLEEAHDIIFGNDAKKERGLATQLADAGSRENAEVILKAARFRLKQTACKRPAQSWLVERLLADYMNAFENALPLHQQSEHGSPLDFPRASSIGREI